jgi:hypothetical protein
MTGSAKTNTVPVTEFGVGVENTDGRQLVLVPIDDKIQTALEEMVSETRAQLSAMDPTPYQPSEKYGSTEGLRDDVGFVRASGQGAGKATAEVDHNNADAGFHG